MFLVAAVAIRCSADSTIRLSAITAAMMRLVRARTPMKVWQAEEVVHGRRGREWPDTAYRVSDSDCRYHKRCGGCATHPQIGGPPR